MAFDPLSQTRIGLIAGYLYITTARYRPCEAALEAALVTAQRQGDTVLEAFVRKALASAWAYQGQYQAALRILDEIGPTFRGMPAPLQLPYWIDRAYLRARAMAEGALEPAWPDMQREMNATLTMARRAKHATFEAEQLVNLVFVAERAGDEEAAREALRRYRAAPAAQTAFGRLMAQLLEGRLKVRAQPAAAAEIFERLHGQATVEARRIPSEYTWRALHGQAVALARLKRFDQALAALSSAVDELERVSTQTGLRGGRGAFLDARFGLFDDAVRISLQAGRPDLAFLYSDWARGHLMRTMALRSRLEQLDADRRRSWLDARKRYDEARSALGDRANRRRRLPPSAVKAFDAETEALEATARAAWNDANYVLESTSVPTFDHRAVDALKAALREGEVLVAFHEIDGQRWWFRVDTLGLTAAERSDGDPRAIVRDAETVYLIPSLGLPIERLMQQWVAVLVQNMKVSIVPTAAVLRVPLADAQGPALVVGDPEQNLPEARAEAQRVASLLKTEAVIGRRATRSGIMARLAGARLFHFAGHGALDDADPWRAMLRLSGGTAIRLEDLWARPVAPGVAVLSGCETGRPSKVGRRLRVMLPAAFLLAGTRAVLASTRRVADAEAARFMMAFYAQGGAERPLTAYRAVAREQIRRGEKNWAAFFVGGRGP